MNSPLKDLFQLLLMEIFTLQFTPSLQRTCDHFMWVDDHVNIAEKRSLLNLEREIRQLRATLLTRTSMLRKCRESELVLKTQVEDATQGEVVWMSLFVLMLVMYVIHVTVTIVFGGGV